MSKLVAMFDNYIADCTQTEVVSPQETSEDDAFLDAILATSVMQQAHQFLVTKGFFKLLDFAAYSSLLKCLL